MEELKRGPRLSDGEFATLFALGNPEGCAVSSFRFEGGVAFIEYKNGEREQINLDELRSEA